MFLETQLRMRMKMAPHGHRVHVLRLDERLDPFRCDGPFVRFRHGSNIQAEGELEDPLLDHTVVHAPSPIAAHEITEQARPHTEAVAIDDGLPLVADGDGERVALATGSTGAVVWD